MIGRYFRIDPLSIVKSSYFDFALRVAAWRYVATREAEQAEKARAKKSS